MSNKRGKKDQPMTESMKIRFYVMNLIYHHPRACIKLPSIRELAKQIGVANSTVTLVLNKLKEEKFLFSRHGVGIFTNPESTRYWEGCVPIIGMVYGFGKNFYYQKSAWNQIAEIGKALCEKGYSIRFITLQGTSRETVCGELKNSYLDGLVWIESNEITKELLDELRASGIGVVTVNCRCGDSETVEIPYGMTASKSSLVADKVEEALKNRTGNR